MNESMKELLEEQEKEYSKIKRGSIISVKINKISQDEIIVLLNYIFDGVIKRSEVEEDFDNLYKVGDDINVLITSISTKDSLVYLSKKEADKKIDFKEIKEAFNNNKKINVKVYKNIEQGVFAKYKTQDIFIPISHLSISFISDTSKYVGQNLDVYLIDIDESKNKIVASHKKVAIEEKSIKKQEQFNDLEVGDIVFGKVVKIMKYGAFVNLGHVEGLIYINELSWDRVKNVEDIVKVGDEVKVSIISIDYDNKKIGLSLKDKATDPWNNITFEKGDIVFGKIFKIIEKGAFVEISNGIEGFLPISQLAEEKVVKITNVIKVDDEMNFMVLDIDKENKKLIISLKEVNKEPEEDYSEYLNAQGSVGTIGDLLKSKLKNY